MYFFIVIMSVVTLRTHYLSMTNVSLDLEMSLNLQWKRVKYIVVKGLFLVKYRVSLFIEIAQINRKVRNLLQIYENESSIFTFLSVQYIFPLLIWYRIICCRKFAVNKSQGGLLVEDAEEGEKSGTKFDGNVITRL